MNVKPDKYSWHEHKTELKPVNLSISAFCMLETRSSQYNVDFGLGLQLPFLWMALREVFYVVPCDGKD